MTRLCRARFCRRGQTAGLQGRGLGPRQAAGLGSQGGFAVTRTRARVTRARTTINSRIIIIMLVQISVDRQRLCHIDSFEKWPE